MGLTWWLARELIASTADRAAARRAWRRFADPACGAGTDHLATGQVHSLTAITDAYMAQLACLFRRPTSGSSRWRAARSPRPLAGPRDYLDVYGAVLKQAARPVILHWLGEAFDPGAARPTGAAATSSPARRRPCSS